MILRLGPFAIIIGRQRDLYRLAYRARGPKLAGVVYTVGESGPERFVAPADGVIIPSGGLARHTHHMGIPCPDPVERDYSFLDEE